MMWSLEEKQIYICMCNILRIRGFHRDWMSLLCSQTLTTVNTRKQENTVQFLTLCFAKLTYFGSVCNNLIRCFDIYLEDPTFSTILFKFTVCVHIRLPWTSFQYCPHIFFFVFQSATFQRQLSVFVFVC